MKNQFLAIGKFNDFDKKVLKKRGFDFSALKKLCINLIKSSSDKNESLDIVSNNPKLNYSYIANINEKKITFKQKTKTSSTELELIFDKNKLFLNKMLNNSSKDLFVKYFNQIINDLSSNKASIKVHKKGK